MVEFTDDLICSVNSASTFCERFDCAHAVVCIAAHDSGPGNGSVNNVIHVIRALATLQTANWLISTVVVINERLPRFVEVPQLSSISKNKGYSEGTSVDSVVNPLLNEID